MKTTRLILLLTSAFIISANSFSQQDTARQADRTQFKIGIYYNTKLNYYGRTDNLQSSGAFPLAELWLTHNFYVNAATVFTNNKVNGFQYAGTIATVGYQFNRNDRFAGNLYAVKPFYESKSQLVQTALKAQVAANFTWLDKFVNFTIGGDLKFSDHTDFGGTAGLDHLVRLKLNTHTLLIIDPSVYIYAGTQQFTKTYLNKSSGFLLLPGGSQLVDQTTRKFNILSYELSLPVIIGVGKIQVVCTPAYVLPQNLVVVENRPDLSEKGERMLYFTTGIKMAI